MLKVLLEQLSEVVDALDPDAIPLCEVPTLWKDFARGERLMASAKTLLARRVEEGDTWRGAGYRSAAEQMAALSGTSVSTAKTEISVSKKVKKLPKTASAMRKGSLSPAKVEAIAGAADVDPDAEDKLLDGAEKKPLGQLREECLRARAKDRDRAHARIRRERYAREYRDAEGAWNFHARGTLDDVSGFRAEWKRATDAQFKLAKAESRDEPLEAYAFDALMELADHSAGRDTPSHDNAGAEPAEPTPNAETKATRASAKYLALIRLDYEALVRGAIDGEETCEIAGLGPIPVRIARERLGEAILKLVVTKGVDVANVTHLGRSVTVAQQVALWWLSPTCTREGCTRTERLENDHREEWVKTKHTRLDELDRLCGYDHDLKTTRGWSLVHGKGKRAMVPPDDPRHPKYRAPPDV
jgi:hypothetical protein